MTVIIFHADIDGMAANQIVRKKLEQKAYSIATTYGNDIKWDRLRKGETVYMLDISLPYEEMKRLESEYNLIHIDHHHTHWDSQAKADGFNPKGIRTTEGDAACILTWKYMYPNEPVPEAIKLISAFDVWDLDDQVIAFNYALNKHTMRFYTPNNGALWKGIVDNDVNITNQLLEEGKALSGYEDTLCPIAHKEMLFETEFAGHSALVANTRNYSTLFFRKAEQTTDLLILYSYIQKKNAYRFTVAATRDDIDVPTILKPHKGGGRGTIGGFTSNTIPFELTGTPRDLVYKNEYQDAYDLMKTDKSVRKYGHAMMNGTINSNFGLISFEGYQACTSNTFHTSPAPFIKMYHEHGAELGVAWMWTNYCRFKLVIHALDPSIDLTPIMEKYNGEIVDGAVWAYVDQLPFAPIS